MKSLPRLRSFLSALFRRRRLEADMEQEWGAHLDEHVDALVAAGMSPDDARRRARRDFGDPLRLKEEALEVRGVGWVNGLDADIRYGFGRCGVPGVHGARAGHAPPALDSNTRSSAWGIDAVCPAPCPNPIGTHGCGSPQSIATRRLSLAVASRVE